MSQVSSPTVNHQLFEMGFRNGISNGILKWDFWLIWDFEMSQVSSPTVNHQLFFRNVTGFITYCEPQGVSISRCWFRRSEILDPRCSWRKIRKIHESSKFIQNESTVVHLCALKDEKTPTDAIWVCQQWKCFPASKTVTNASLWLSNWKLLERSVIKTFDLPRVSAARRSLKIVQLKRVCQRETTKMS